MSDKIDQFCANLNRQLNAVDQRLAAMKANITASHKNTEAAVQKQLDKVKTDFEARKHEAESAREKMHAYIRDKKAETEAKITGWKTRRELDKLERRAEDAEEYAAHAVLVAVSAVDEADVAMLEAIAARIEADEAQTAAV